FREIYKEGYEICLNVERVMEMFSKELYELDRNTVQYMIDEMQDTIDVQKNEIDAQKNEIDTQKNEINAQKDMIDAQKAAIDKQHRKIEEMQKEQEKLYHQSISGTVNILRSLNIPEQEISMRICEQYQLSGKQAQKYL
ncbi:MAG: hypothetical protein K2J99_11330, partial [Lachnospiraceae bacterium]|nr:hypothetical protein [Lachnospiraceae bacterium]